MWVAALLNLLKSVLVDVAVTLAMRVTDFLSKLWKRKEADQKIDQHADVAVKETIDAKTEAEMDQADIDVLSGGKR